VLHDAPARVQPVARRRSDSRLIGEIVHEALRWWGPVHAGLDDLLHNLAWENGVVDDAERTVIVREAARLLGSIQRSDIFAWLETARRTYSELPFIYRQGDRILHGVVDLLLQRDDGSWAVVDYKTGYVASQPLHEHARRYHLQVGAYAEALSTHLILAGLMRPGTAPAVYIHYIRHQQTITVTPDEWRAALAALERQIDKVLM
jgi:ATP-dependent exoDNAse (exonuclease V) beta subunit